MQTSRIEIFCASPFVRARFVFVVTMLSICFSFAVQALTAQSIPVQGVPVPAFATVDSAVVRFLREHKIPGASVGVTKDGRLVYARGYGYANTQTMALVQPESRFRLASVSKPVTATAILRLVQEQKFGLDDKIVKLLGVSTATITDPRWLTITVRHLLQHSGGWDRDKSVLNNGGYWEPWQHWQQIQQATGLQLSVDAIIRYMTTKPLDFAPGTRYAYSNIGFVLLGRIVERASGMPFEQYVRTILSQAGVSNINNWQLGTSLGRGTNEVQYYSPNLSGLNNERFMETGTGAGNLVVSATDYLRFLEVSDGLVNATPFPAGDMLNSTMLAARRAVPSFATDVNRYYGLGWAFGPMMISPVGKTAYHGGYLAGTSTLALQSDGGLSYVILLNANPGVYGTGNSSMTDIEVAIQQVHKQGIIPNDLNLFLPTQVLAAPRFTGTDIVRALSNTAITAAWTKSLGAASYQFDLSTDATFKTGTMLNGYNSQKVLTEFVGINLLTLANANPQVISTTRPIVLYARVRATNATVQSPYSGTARLVFSALAPNARTATKIQAQTLTAQWTTVPLADAYEVFVATSSTFSTVLRKITLSGGAVSSTVINNLKPKTQYWYRVRPLYSTWTSSDTLAGTMGASTTATTLPSTVVVTAALPQHEETLGETSEENLDSPLAVNPGQNNSLSEESTKKSSALLSDIPQALVVTAFPNPFVSVLHFKIHTPLSSAVRVEIVNEQANSVITVFDGTLEAGDHIIDWNADSLSAARSILYYRMTVNGRPAAVGRLAQRE